MVDHALRENLAHYSEDELNIGTLQNATALARSVLRRVTPEFDPRSWFHRADVVTVTKDPFDSAALTALVQGVRC